MTVLAVTGSTGALGGLVARALGPEVDRLVVRDASRAPRLEGDPEVVEATYADLDAGRRALAGVDVLFMVSAAESPVRREEHRTFIRAAAEAGVGHIVYTSFAGAAPDAIFTLGRDHHDAEEAIRASGDDLDPAARQLLLRLLPAVRRRAGRRPRPGRRGPRLRGRAGRRRRGGRRGAARTRPATRARPSR